ncbi:hypothetical protein HDU83_007735 [Entophlyctis luteolus]|nr:hypothetical protein HDU82_003337 [Entophlyctis luteolus]KAJ3339146.1 hypothetical protein HDU83_007735 [Entophlyctis luteolus]
MAALLVLLFGTSILAKAVGQYCRIVPTYAACTIDAYPVIDPFVGAEFHLQENGVWKGSGTYNVLDADDMNVSLVANSLSVVTSITVACGSNKTSFAPESFAAHSEYTIICPPALGHIVIYGGIHVNLEIKYLYYGGKKAFGGLCYNHDDTCPESQNKLPQFKR